MGYNISNVAFNEAYEKVSSRGTVTTEVLENIIKDVNEQYSSACRAGLKKEIDFSSLWNTALLERGINDLFVRNEIRIALSCYYRIRRNPNPSKTYKASDLKVVYVTVNEARVQIDTGLVIHLGATREFGMLKDTHVVVRYRLVTDVPWPKISASFRKSIIRKARIAINKARRNSATWKKSQKSLKFSTRV